MQDTGGVTAGRRLDRSRRAATQSLTVQVKAVPSQNCNICKVLVVGLRVFLLSSIRIVDTTTATLATWRIGGVRPRIRVRCSQRDQYMFNTSFNSD